MTVNPCKQFKCQLKRPPDLDKAPTFGATPDTRFLVIGSTPINHYVHVRSADLDCPCQPEPSKVPETNVLQKPACRLPPNGLFQPVKILMSNAYSRPEC